MKYLNGLRYARVLNGGVPDAPIRNLAKPVRGALPGDLCTVERESVSPIRDRSGLRLIASPGSRIALTGAAT